MSILIIDPCCPKPYTFDSLEQEAMGGTEATVLRVASALQEKTPVAVEQHNRTESQGIFHPPGVTKTASHVIIVRAEGALEEARNRFPYANLYLWMHDLAPRSYAQYIDLFARLKTTVLTVSDWHRTQVGEVLRSGGYAGQFKLRRIYNPIDNKLVPNNTAVDPNKLVFFSSPHKGLERTLYVFRNLRSFLPNATLYLANPGYYPNANTAALEGVVNLGALPHSAIMDQVRSALCVFHLNSTFPETFGLVYAEANAVGTPCLTAALGATTEVLDHPAETLDISSDKAVIDRVLAWHSGARPAVRGNPQFRLSAVAREWANLLNL